VLPAICGTGVSAFFPLFFSSLFGSFLPGPSISANPRTQDQTAILLVCFLAASSPWTSLACDAPPLRQNVHRPFLDGQSFPLVGLRERRRPGLFSTKVVPQTAPPSSCFESPLSPLFLLLVLSFTTRDSSSPSRGRSTFFLGVCVPSQSHHSFNSPHLSQYSPRSRVGR